MKKYASAVYAYHSNACEIQFVYAEYPIIHPIDNYTNFQYLDANSQNYELHYIRHEIRICQENWVVIAWLYFMYHRTKNSIHSIQKYKHFYEKSAWAKPGIRIRQKSTSAYNAWFYKQKIDFTNTIKNGHHLQLCRLRETGEPNSLYIYAKCWFYHICYNLYKNAFLTKIMIQHHFIWVSKIDIEE